jgi:hypothetical protein
VSRSSDVPRHSLSTQALTPATIDMPFLIALHITIITRKFAHLTRDYIVQCNRVIIFDKN